MVILTFGVVDYVVLAVILFVPMVIGIIFRFRGGQEKTTSDYLTGSRQMSSAPVAISLSVSFLSGITILGLSAEVYLQGITIMFGCIGCVIGVVISSALMVPIYHPLKLTSINQVII